MGVLEKINSPEDLRRLDETELPELCRELRQLLIYNISKTGGHLASNLGVVELTVAIHRVFDTSRDRLIFDVGHQSYIHKILTGRKDGMPGIRSYGGISGFPKPSESIHDAFIAGHASSAVSAALGMARARTLLGEDYRVIALLGDGALTGGLAYEGLSNAGDSDEPLIVILNDNGMSINENVGGIARYLSRERIKRGYISFKNVYRKITKKIPGGKRIYNLTHRIKTVLKKAIFHCSMFEDMGFAYLGPVDGHNIKMLISALKIARDSEGPVLLHVITKKGKGYKFAEDNPNTFHGLSGFDPVTGKEPAPQESFSSVFGAELVKLANRDRRITAITAAMPGGTGLAEFAETFPDRFSDVGIAEGHAAVMAGGEAHKGLIPVYAVYSTFLQRAYDMLIQDVAMGQEHVVLAVDRAGLVGQDGETHHGVFDVSFLTSIPNMTVLAPASFQELRDMLDMAVETFNGPIAIRYPKGGEGRYRDGGTQASCIIREGSDFTIITYGIMVNNAMEAADILEEQGISVEILKLGYIKPLDIEAVERAAEHTGRLLVLEDCLKSGGIGEKIASLLMERGVKVKSYLQINLGDSFITHGCVDELMKLSGLDGASIADDIKKELRHRGS